MKWILTTALVGMAFAGMAQRDLNPRNGNPFGGAQSFKDYNLYGIQFQLGPTFLMNSPRNERYDVNGVFRGDYLHNPKTRLGAYAEIGMFHFPKKRSKLSQRLKFIFVSYYDWGLGFKYFRGAEQITANFEDASGNYIGSEDRTFNFSNGNVYGRFSLHKNIHFHPKKRREKLNFFLDNSLGINFDYRVMQTADTYTDWYGVMEQNQQYYRPFHAQLHYGLGFGWSPRRGMFIIPGVSLPIVGYHSATTAMDGSGDKQNYWGKPSMHFFSSRYWPILFNVKFMFALPKKQKGCATGITNDQDQETQRNR
ncbi:MAG: hypothetical protein NXI10_03075 [bacterium]|nr:hypothetical protein [bacterium]